LPDIILIIASIFIISIRVFTTNDGNSLIFDDSYMQLRYAEHLLGGGSYSWNYGVPSYGCTSIIYILYLGLYIILFKILGMNNPVYIMQTASISMFIIYNIFIYRIKTIILKNNVLYSILLFMISLSSLIFYNTYNAIETMASLASLTLLAYLCIRLVYGNIILNFGNIALVCVSGFIAYSVRPDNGIYALLLPLFTLLYLQKNKIALQFLILFLLLISIDTYLKYIYFGNPLPLTFYIKQGNYYEGYMAATIWSPFLYLAEIIRSLFWLPGTVAIVYYNKKKLKAALIFLIPLLITFIYYFSITQIMGSDARFYIPSTAIMLTVFMLLTDSKIPYMNRSILRAGTIILLAIFITLPSIFEIIHYKVYAPFKTNAVLLESSFYRDAIKYEDHKRAKQYEWQPLIFKVDTLLSLMDDSGVFAATEYGYLGYKHSAMTIMDLAGLHDKSTALHGYRNAQLESYSPDLIWMPHYYYTGLYYNLISSPYFIKNYLFFPYLYNYGIAVRKDSRYKSKLLQEIQRQL